jgi:hypothetical protein
MTAKPESNKNMSYGTDMADCSNGCKTVCVRMCASATLVHVWFDEETMMIK